MNKKRWKKKFEFRDSTRFLKHNPPRRSALHGEARDAEHIMDILERYQDDEAAWRFTLQDRAYKQGRRTEGFAAAIEPPRSRRWRGMMAVREAREITAHRLFQGHTALKMLKLMYWPGTDKEKLTRRQAAAALGIKNGRSKRIQKGFARLVEERYMRKGD